MSTEKLKIILHPQARDDLVLRARKFPIPEDTKEVAYLGCNCFGPLLGEIVLLCTREQATEIVSEDLQIRSRIRLQFTVHLNAKKTHRLIAGSEQLFSISKDTRLNTWTTFDYSDSRSFILLFLFIPNSALYF